MFSRTWRVHKTALPRCLAHLLILVCLELSLIIRRGPYVSGLLELGPQIN